MIGIRRCEVECVFLAKATQTQKNVWEQKAKQALGFYVPGWPQGREREKWYIKWTHSGSWAPSGASLPNCTPMTSWWQPEILQNQSTYTLQTGKFYNHGFLSQRAHQVQSMESIIYVTWTQGLSTV
jgi:hypothetical protein